MRIIKPSVSEISEADPLKKIEICGRICYKSEDKITEDSATAFVKMLAQKYHFAMTEHATLALVFPNRSDAFGLASEVRLLGHGTFINVTRNRIEDRIILSGNLRAWRELLQFSSLPSSYKQAIHRTIEFDHPDVAILLLPSIHANNSAAWGRAFTQEEFLNSIDKLNAEEKVMHLYYTAHFICDRGVSHELVRHRPCSFAQESTRYCNYAQNKFGEELTVIEPFFFEKDSWVYTEWYTQCESAEETYLEMIKQGIKAQEARSILPNSLKTEVAMTCCLGEWNIIFSLRLPNTAHPQMREVMTPWYHLMLEKSEVTNVLYINTDK
jgi:thymidylate synthase (FAD)